MPADVWTWQEAITACVAMICFTACAIVFLKKMLGD